MARTVAPMDVRMAAAIADETVDVAAYCRAHQISRQTFYKWRARFRAEGVAGLGERSRRPHRVANLTEAGLEDLVVATRKRLAEDGADCGPDPIRWALLAADVAPPATATVSRILLRRGLVVPCPARRPKSANRRFSAARPNEMWQSDWTEVALADGTAVAIAGTLDDHSRLLTGIGAAAGDGTGELVWAVMATAIAGHGIPMSSLTDNGMCYSMARRGSQSAFEANLAALGCTSIASRPYHPQTCGKIERFWQTLKKWLAKHGAPSTSIAELNTALVIFTDYYNHHRPHRALNGHTPAEIFTATQPARPATRPLPTPLTASPGTVDADGKVAATPYSIGVGRRWSGQPVTVIKDGDHVTIFAGNRLVHELDADPTRRYQPAPPGPRTHRHREPQQ